MRLRYIHRMDKHEIYYKAMLARDHRFDGKFFIGVKTTGIFCRPICPAKPKKENVEFFASAAAAERAGYRPCMRCHPEAAPLSPLWTGTSAVVQRALRIIAANAELPNNENAFAEVFGLSARHLRRLFDAEIGKTPKQIIHENRLNFARKLILETQLPMTSIALSAGFRSLRRFNDAFQKRFRAAPSDFRKKTAARRIPAFIQLSLDYRPPLDWPSLLHFYRAHQITGVEWVDENAYERIFAFGKNFGLVRITQEEKAHSLRLQVWAENPAMLFSLAQKARMMFDLDSDPLLIANCFQSSRLLDSLWKRYPGLRIARGWDPFESAVCTILGQLVSTEQAKILIEQLVQNYGKKIPHPLKAGGAFLFPTAADLAKCDLEHVKTTQSRKKTIREISRLVAAGKIDFHTPKENEEMKSQLLAVPGIGPWTAEYICMRALGDTNAFPGSDLILKRACERHPELDLEKIQPWRAYAAVYLWQHYAQSLSKKKGAKIAKPVRI